MTAAACEVSIGDPSAAKFGAITSCASSPIAHDVAGDLEQAPLHGFVEHLAAIRDGAHDRPPQVVLAARGMLDLALLEDAG